MFFLVTNDNTNVLFHLPSQKADKFVDNTITGISHRHRNGQVSTPITFTLHVCCFKGCVSLDPSKIQSLDDGVSSWIHDNCVIVCDMAWLIPNFISIKKILFLYHTTSDGVTVQCFKLPSWPLRDGLDLWPQLIYTLYWESQHEEI